MKLWQRSSVTQNCLPLFASAECSFASTCSSTVFAAAQTFTLHHNSGLLCAAAGTPYSYFCSCKSKVIAAKCMIVVANTDLQLRTCILQRQFFSAARCANITCRRIWIAHAQRVSGSLLLEQARVMNASTSLRRKCPVIRLHRGT